MPKKLSVKYRRPPALIINRVAFRDKKLVYVARANKKFRYPWGRSRIVYFGTTKIRSATDRLECSVEGR